MAYFPARNYKIILCTFTEYKNGLSIYDTEKIKKYRKNNQFNQKQQQQQKKKTPEIHTIFQKLDVEGQAFQQYFKQKNRIMV